MSVALHAILVVAVVRTWPDAKSAPPSAPPAFVDDAPVEIELTPLPESAGAVGPPSEPAPRIAVRASSGRAVATSAVPAAPATVTRSRCARRRIGRSTSCARSPRPRSSHRHPRRRRLRPCRNLPRPTQARVLSTADAHDRRRPRRRGRPRRSGRRSAGTRAQHAWAAPVTSRGRASASSRRMRERILCTRLLETPSLSADCRIETPATMSSRTWRSRGISLLAMRSNCGSRVGSGWRRRRRPVDSRLAAIGNAQPGLMSVLLDQAKGQIDGSLSPLQLNVPSGEGT